VSTRFRSVIAFGRIGEIADEEKRQNVYELFIRRLCRDFIPGGMEYIKKHGSKAKVYAIDIEHITGKESK